MPKYWWRDRYRSVDRTTAVATTGTPILFTNPRRLWAAFTNTGTTEIDIYWITQPGDVVTGRVQLQPNGSLVIGGITPEGTLIGDMPWQGFLSATSLVAAGELQGVEVEEVL